MATIFAKTPEGQKEIADRARGLSGRARSLLILVDGKRSVAELGAMVPDAQVHLEALLKAGLIAPAASASPANPPPAPAQRQPQPKSVPGTAPVAAAQDLADLRRDAARAINDLLGPDGDSLAMRIERAANADELRAALERCAAFIADARGRRAAEGFAQRFLG